MKKTSLSLFLVIGLFSAGQVFGQGGAPEANAAPAASAGHGEAHPPTAVEQHMSEPKAEDPAADQTKAPETPVISQGTEGETAVENAESKPAEKKSKKKKSKGKRRRTRSPNGSAKADVPSDVLGDLDKQNAVVSADQACDSVCPPAGSAPTKVETVVETPACETPACETSAS